MNFYYFCLWVIGFIITFGVSYIFLRLATAKKRPASTAIFLRSMAVVLAVILAWLTSYDGVNGGSCIAFLVILGMSLLLRKRE